MMPSVRYCPWCGTANQSALPRCLSCGFFFQSRSSSGRDEEQPLNHMTRWLKQRYLIMRCIGMGGMGIVYEAVDSVLHRRVAVKQMRLTKAFPYQEREAANAFQREAVLLAQLDHIHLPKIYDYFSERGCCYLVMEFIAGTTLEAYLDAIPGRRLPIYHVLALGIQLCSVLDFLHTRPSPIIFRDLKPSNIMITTSGKLYLIDFGIARYARPGAGNDTLLLGTPGYAAPEQYGKTQTTPRSDLYSLGAILHQLVTGDDPSRSPFQFAALDAGKYAIPVELAQLIWRMLDLHENNRPASAMLIRKQLQDIARVIKV